MFDILDLLKPREDYVMAGSYRKQKSDPPQYFEYAEVDYPSKSFGEIINNLITTKQGLTIRTMWDCGYEVEGYIVTQDGRMWTIEQIQVSHNNGEELRLLRHGVNDEFIIALVCVDNPMELK